jgi:site-specific DNA-methyltransferase (adenine-specific)/adenine-specific DNA-methyltransferase
MLSPNSKIIMPTLEWIGKSAVVNHHRQVPYHLLRCDSSLSVGDTDSGNLLVQGDNLLALKALLPYYAGKVKCIYIDPPYNTGEEKWVYNDNVNSPEIRKWLGQVVGREFEDLSRHDKWLCMMYPRLALLKDFLSLDGAIFVSLDDNEIGPLRAIMDEIFGERNFISSIIWQKRTSPDSRLPLGPAHDYIVVYAKSADKLKGHINKVPLSGARANEYKNPDNDPRGPWASVDLTGQTGHATDEQYYTITGPTGKKYPPPKGRCWAIAEATILKMIKDNRVWFGKKGTARPRTKKFLRETEGVTAWTWWPNLEVGHNQEATKELLAIMGGESIFDNPKPTRLIKRVLQLCTEPGSLVLDSFAGSGTTGHAVLQLNKEDNGNRRFILVEMEPDICQNITCQRLKHVIQGYNNNEKHADGLGGSFRYCRLNEPLFDEAGHIRDNVTFTELAAHVFFTETGSPIPKPASGRSPLLGVYEGTAVYLLFNGVLGDKRPNGGNVLTSQVLKQLPAHEGPRVIYGEGSRLSSDRLRREGIVFKQVPYQIKVG